jgi:hypothetical protein
LGNLYDDEIEVEKFSDYRISILNEKSKFLEDCDFIFKNLL